MYYIFQNGEEFGFKCSNLHEINPDDVMISEDVYKKFFDAQCCGLSLRIKDINGTTFEEIFEEYVPVFEETDAEKIIRLQNRLHDTDRMVIECYEYNMLGLDMPYDMAALHEERTMIKNEIKALQQNLAI